jgi:hypothetical protein
LGFGEANVEDASRDEYAKEGRLAAEAEKMYHMRYIWCLLVSMVAARA